MKKYASDFSHEIGTITSEMTSYDDNCSYEEIMEKINLYIEQVTDILDYKRVPSTEGFILAGKYHYTHVYILRSKKTERLKGISERVYINKWIDEDKIGDRKIVESPLIFEDDDLIEIQNVSTIIDIEKIRKNIYKNLNKKGIQYCRDYLEKQFEKIDHTPFHIVLKINISNKKEKFSQYLNAFVEKALNHHKIKALYTEMNAFDINTDEWFGDVFSYKKYGGLKDFDWLSDYDFSTKNSFKLTGMKKIRNVYSNYMTSDKIFSVVKELADYIVILKYQEFVISACKSLNHKNLPILITAHDYDFIYKHMIK